MHQLHKNGGHSITCDICANEGADYDKLDFSQVIKDLERNGWTIRKSNTTLTFTCPKCTRKL